MQEYVIPRGLETVNEAFMPHWTGAVHATLDREYSWYFRYILARYILAEPLQRLVGAHTSKKNGYMFCLKNRFARPSQSPP